MDIGIFLSIIFIPPCVISVLSMFRQSSSKASKTMSDKEFIVRIPNVVLVVGMLCALMSMIVLLGFTFFSDKLPHLIFYIVFGLFFWLGMYLVLKTIKFKVIVKNEKITVYSILKKPYSFTFNEVNLVVRQVKKNKEKSERIVIKTTLGRKLIVESGEIAYKMNEKKVESEVEKKYLFGFN